MRNQLIRHLTVLTALLLGGCQAEAVPDRPSWDQDVFPILQGSCNHCHGSTIGQPGGPVGRLDVCSPAPFASLGITIPNLLGASAEAPVFGEWLNAKKDKPRAAMPPAPAPELGSYEKDVLLKWARIVAVPMGNACAKQTRNRDPKAVLVRQAVNEENDLVVTLETSDPDGDQVLGKISVGGTAKPILSSGRYDHVFAGQSTGAAVKVTIHDGYVASPVVLDF